MNTEKNHREQFIDKFLFLHTSLLEAKGYAGVGYQTFEPDNFFQDQLELQVTRMYAMRARSCNPVDFTIADSGFLQGGFFRYEMDYRFSDDQRVPELYRVRMGMGATVIELDTDIKKLPVLPSLFSQTLEARLKQRSNAGFPISDTTSITRDDTMITTIRLLADQEQLLDQKKYTEDRFPSAYPHGDMLKELACKLVKAVETAKEKNEPAEFVISRIVQTSRTKPEVLVANLHYRFNPSDESLFITALHLDLSGFKKEIELRYNQLLPELPDLYQQMRHLRENIKPDRPGGHDVGHSFRMR